MRTKTRVAAAAALAATAALAIATSAFAAISPTRDPGGLGPAIAGDADTEAAITDASFLAMPPNGNPVAVSTTRLSTFPLVGNSYAILSTGDATLADAPNNASNTSANNAGGNAGHGQVHDVVTVAFDLVVPESANCLTLEFRLLSEEFPEFLGSSFNDGFVAELDQTTFVVGGPGVVDAPDNIAVDESGKPPTVNTTGTSADNALGTTYDGATPILRATSAVSPGPHTLFLSVYDASDAIYDTSVFVDNLRLRSAAPQHCRKGAAPTPATGGRCQGKVPNVIAADGVAVGTRGDDVIVGSRAHDDIRGRGGDDLICGRAGKDLIRGGRGDDVIRGNDGRDELRGSRGNDKLIGGKHADLLRGLAGRDDLRGNRGADTLNGGAGRDRCRVGKGGGETRLCER